MENSHDAMRLPESIYDEMLAKATSSQYGYTNEEVDSAWNETYEKYAKHCDGFGSFYKTWLVEHLTWANLCRFPFRAFLDIQGRAYLDTNQVIVPSERRLCRTSNFNASREEIEYRLELLTHVVSMERDAKDRWPNHAPVAEGVTGLGLVENERWDGETLVNTGSEMEVESTLAAMVDGQRKRSMPSVPEEARKRVKTKEDM